MGNAGSRTEHGRDSRPVLVTGATGYIGGRLVPRLLEAGYAVRCLARSPRKLIERSWAADPRVGIVQGDVTNDEVLVDALRGCGPAYYLVRSLMSAGTDHAVQDHEMARRFAEAAKGASLTRIICLSELGERGVGSSAHASRPDDVKQILASSGTPVTVLRAAMIIGSGSASFEILRCLAERPIMVTPRWVSTRCQPIAVRDVIQYLVACLSAPETANQTFDIGGPDVLTYRDLLRIMTEELGLRRRIVIPVPVLTPRLSRLWIRLTTPIDHRLATSFVEGLRGPAVCRNNQVGQLIPLRLLTVRETIRLALLCVQELNVPTIWSAAGPIPKDPGWSEGTVLTDRRSIDLPVPPAAVYQAVCRMGGRNGWYGADPLWLLRGALDRLVGGPGLRRGRRHPEALSFGETVDFWRAVGLERNRMLTLRAEMKVPGEAELELAIEPRDAQGGPLPAESAGRAPCARLTQTARFRPHGLVGHLYWHAMRPFHAVIFRRMLRGIRAAAEPLAGAARDGAAC